MARKHEEEVLNPIAHLTNLGLQIAEVRVFQIVNFGLPVPCASSDRHQEVSVGEHILRRTGKNLAAVAS